MSETSRLMMWALTFFLIGIAIETSVFWVGFNMGQKLCECEEVAIEKR
jgi:hypothetical protein|tara:strand:- start:268 stop:411 length:144 start_codon:yes stop_codon:yes gene_type:complete